MNDDRAKQGVEHLQAAAIEMIGAFRAFLDLAEDVVRDPSAVTAFAASLVETARAAAPSASPSAAAGAEGSAEPRVTRIRVS
ncbi:MAG TPA: hypothetical protein VM143_06220 [Acidimicrobiales bacterium]|nr:hypothetical protein [Acidimicrobiales bacterium]